MQQAVFLISLPGLDAALLEKMPFLASLAGNAELKPSFPAVTCSVQANMVTGKRPDQHGVIANGFYWRDQQRVEMWTSPADCIEAPTLWDVLAKEGKKSAVWFPLHSKGCLADYVCSPAPIHNPDGTETLWCYSQPETLYGELRDQLGHFPLQHYWGPLTHISASAWILDSALLAAQKHHPDFFYLYLPALDYAPQKEGPSSEATNAIAAETDTLIKNFVTEINSAYPLSPHLFIAGEYAITPTTHVSYPNRILREAGLLEVVEKEDFSKQGVSMGTREFLDLENSRAFAMVDHQISHIFVQKGVNPEEVAALFRDVEGIEEVLSGDALAKYSINHANSGEVVLISTPESWQAYYYWFDTAKAPVFAKNVDIHRKPGYDPIELFLAPSGRSIPLDATLASGSHGIPGVSTRLLASDASLLTEKTYEDVDIFQLVLEKLL